MCIHRCLARQITLGVPAVGIEMFSKVFFVANNIFFNSTCNCLSVVTMTAMPLKHIHVRIYIRWLLVLELAPYRSRY